uniref:Retrovirus-related Pol polyprotein from transposon TNT 1-94-like beta-barrel domain-containing protein n=1 Tax=Cajanus cajan TaxID=3821 RepID=A0A151TEJ2_CAJCA|nr:hypothetical protein KK1_011678 [Cajanus cajan]
MTSKKDWFVTYKEIGNGKILVENNSACSIVSKGITHIKMVDGIVRTLIDVKYVPKLQTNLISLSTLDSLSCLY